MSISDPRTNDRIRVPEVRLIGPSGEQVGVVAIEVALRLAQEADLDLVEVAPGSKPPVAKIMDYGKYKYEAAQKAKEARRNQANTILKEVRFRLKIDDHDYETKRKRAIGFLNQGDKVKAMILFRGREQSRPEQGVRLLQRFAEDVAEFGTVEHTPTIDGRNMVMIIGPLRSKTDAKAEQNAKRNAAKEAARDARTTSTERVAQARPSEEERSELVETAVIAEAEIAAEVETAVEAAEVAEVKPAAAKTPATKPAAAKSTAAKPAAAKTTAAKPAATKTTAAKTSSTSAAAKPAAAKSTAAKPAATKPAAKAKPATDES